MGKSQLCDMTEFSGAKDKEVIDGNTILLEIGKENNINKYVYNGGDMICSFLTIDEIYKYISNMGNNLSPYSFATGEENYYLLDPNFIFTKIDRIDYDTILDGIYVPDSDLKEYFEEIELYKIIQIMINTILLYLNFCKDAVFYDYKNIGIICEMNPVRIFIKQFFILEFL